MIRGKIHRKIKSGIIFLFLWSFCFVACTPNNNGSDYTDLPTNGWAYGDTLCFKINTVDSVVPGTLSVAVDHSDSYLYNNLWLEVSYIADNINGRKEEFRDTLQIILTDSAGNWKGTGAASNFQTEVPFGKRNFYSEYPVRIRHIMRTDTLKGMNRVGVFFNDK